jgi:hypothetical protein
MAGKSRSLGSLLVNVGADTRALDAGLKSATSQVNQFGNRTAATTRKASSNFKNVGGAAMGIGGGLAARAGAAGLAALGPALAVGAIGGAITSAANLMEDSPRNMMRKLNMQMRQQRIQFSSGKMSDFLSDVSFYSPFSGNIYELGKLNAMEYLTGVGGGPNTLDRHMTDFLSPGNRMAEPIPKEWMKDRTIRFSGDLGVNP